jgi:hypothetical protein
MSMISALLLLSLLAPQAPALPGQLIISLVVTDKKGNPITDMKAEEFEIKEGGKVRPAVKAELDHRPLTAAIILDSSQALGNSYQADFVPAVLSLVKQLPEGTEYTVWTTSDRPKQTVPPGTPIDKAEELLRSVAPFGSNAVVDTIVESSQMFNTLDNSRRGAVFVVSSATMGEIRINVQAELPKASMRPTYLATEVIVNQQDGVVERSLDYLAARTAGRHERVFSTMAAQAQLGKMLEFLDAQYRVAWEPAMDPRQAKLEFASTRKDTKVISAQRLSTAW